jgi:hypothetical protein
MMRRHFSETALELLASGAMIPLIFVSLRGLAKYLPMSPPAFLLAASVIWLAAAGMHIYWSPHRKWLVFCHLFSLVGWALLMGGLYASLFERGLNSAPDPRPGDDLQATASQPTHRNVTPNM